MKTRWTGATHLHRLCFHCRKIPTGCRKVEKGTFINPNFVKLRVKGTQKLFAESGSDSASKLKFLALIETHQQRAEMFRDPSGSVYPPMTNSCSWCSLTLIHDPVRFPASYLEPARLPIKPSNPSLPARSKSSGMSFVKEIEYLITPRRFLQQFFQLCLPLFDR
jgi:hypothetical protein